MNDVSSLTEASRALEPKIFSLTRLILLETLRELGQDGISFRELAAALRLQESIIFVNLRALEKMGYVESEPIRMEGKEMTAFHITEMGQEEYEKARKWLGKLISGD